jgi:hypothetical protein
MSFANCGKVWSPETLAEYLKTVQKPTWCNAICLHHTAAPSLTQRPNGFLIQHIRNIESFYKEKGWKSGPHFFTDENEIFGMTPPDIKGIHAVSFNSRAIGIEVLGDYDTEFNDRGRGLECWKTTAKAVKILAEWLNIPINAGTILFHNEDPKTSKTCPGVKVKKQWILDLINSKDMTDKEIAPTDIKPQFVEVAKYLQDIKGYSSSDVARLLTSKDGLYYFGNEWLENAYYDKQKQATIAPISELCSLPKKK